MIDTCFTKGAKLISANLGESCESNVQFTYNFVSDQKHYIYDF